MKQHQDINNDIKNIDKFILTFTSNLYCFNKLNYLINNKGKRIRSLLALHYFYKYKNINSYSIIELYKILAILELTHLASLLHDDVIDNNNSRRNEKSFNYLYGNKNSILIGDYLLINNFNNLLQILHNKKYCNYLMNQFIKASSNTTYGVYLEQNNMNIRDLITIYNNKDFDNIITHTNEYYNQQNFNKEYMMNIDNYINNYNNLNKDGMKSVENCVNFNNEYIKLIGSYKSYINKYCRIAKLKTGSFFKFSCIVGCVLSNIDFNSVKESANFGLIFGIIYQIQNDFNSYKCNSYKESEDYIQSITTFPIIVIQSFTDIKELFYNKNQTNFNKIKKLINTKTFESLCDCFIKKLVEFMNGFCI